MSCGVMSERYLHLQQFPDHLLTIRRRRRSTTTTTAAVESHLWVSFKTHNPKATLSVLSSGSCRFKTRSTVKEDNFMLSELEEEEYMSFYQLLGIPESGSFSEIKQAYKQLARKYHPDVSPPDRTEEYTKRFIQVQEAYEILSDPSRRAVYDRDLSRGLHLAFSARRRYYSHCDDEGVDERSNWRNCWQNQLSGLKKKSMNRDSSNNMSWGARMRRQRDQQAQES